MVMKETTHTNTEFEQEVEQLINDIRDGNDNDLQLEMWRQTEWFTDNNVDRIHEKTKYDDSEVRINNDQLKNNITRVSASYYLALEKLRREVCDRMDELNYTP